MPRILRPRVPLPPFSAALDVAEYGGDANVFVISGKSGMLCGWEVDIGAGLSADTGILVDWIDRLVEGEWTWQWPGPDAWSMPQFAKYRESGLRGFPISPSRIVLDAGGGGKGVYEKLRTRRIYVKAERFGSRPVEARKKSELERANYQTRRAQLYGELLAKCREGGYSFAPGYGKLVQELCAHENLRNKDGVLVLPPKEYVKKRLGRSPDWSDALVMAAAVFDRARPYGLFVPGPLLTSHDEMKEDTDKPFDEAREARELLEWLQYR